MNNFFFSIAHAAVLSDKPESYDWDSIVNLLAQVIGEVLKYAGILASIFILVAAFQYMTSAGDEAKVTRAKQTLYWAIVGVAVITVSFLLVKIVGEFAGLNDNAIINIKK